MKLTYEQIISAANGIIRTEQTELGLELHRFTREQESFFYKRHPLFCKESFFTGFFSMNCRTGSGITLDFISDLKTFKMNFGEIEYAKNKNDKEHLIDLYVDNVFVNSFEVRDEILYKSSGKKQHYTIYFPSYALPIISSVELDGASMFLPQKKHIDILFLGDSITQGAFAVNPSNSYVMRVARNLDIGILNQGNSGFVYDAGSIENVCNPKVVVTAYGINDFTRKNIDLIKSDTIEFLKKVKQLYKNAKIISILPVWTTWNADNKDFKIDERNCLKNIYENFSDCVVDGFDLVPHDKIYFTDEVHPNDDGFKFYGENLTNILKNFV